MQAGDWDQTAVSLERPASMDTWDDLFGFVQTSASEHLQGHSKEYGLLLACEELISNIIRYNPSTAPDGSPLTIRIRSGWAQPGDHPLYRLEISDNGIPFDPRFDTIGAAVDEVPIETRPIGGLGLFLIKSSVDHVAYVHHDQHNVYTIDTDPATEREPLAAD